MKPLTDAQRRGLEECEPGLENGFLAVPEHLEWALVDGLIQRNAPKDIRVFVLTDSGHAALQEARGC